MKHIFRSRRRGSPHKNEEAEKREAPFFSRANQPEFFHGKARVQAKLTVGQQGDQYEKEADAMANAVVTRASGPAKGKAGGADVQRETLATPVDDEKRATAEERMERDKLLQEKPELQQMTGPTEEDNEPPTSMETEGDMLNKKESEAGREEEKEQDATASVQAKKQSPQGNANHRVSQQLIKKAGKGNPMPKNTLNEMEASFGADFTGVNIHSDTEAVAMNQELGAQAFTHGHDIYFNQGKYDPASRNGKHLLAHELTHVVQQNAGAKVRKKEKDSSAGVTNCLNQEGALLPGGVGLAESINREVMLEQILGKDRAGFEKDVKADYKAREFVCEAGISAVMALYYNRDYKNRLVVDKARTRLSQNPELYSMGGFDRSRETRAMLEKTYGISIERGDKDWSPRDLVLLSEALGTLTEKELPLLARYRFARWTNKCNEKRAADPDYGCEAGDYAVCGFHMPDIIRRKYTITMYDCIDTDPAEKMKKGYAVSPGTEYIIHEIGHAMEYGRGRLAVEKAFDAKKEVKRLEAELARASSAGQKAALQAKLKQARVLMESTAKAMENAMGNGALAQFEALIKGKRALTDYSKRNSMEAFAEAFMLFKAAPELLKSKNRKLFNWFKSGGFT